MDFFWSWTKEIKIGIGLADAKGLGSIRESGGLLSRGVGRCLQCADDKISFFSPFFFSSFIGNEICDCICKLFKREGVWEEVCNFLFVFFDVFEVVLVDFEFVFLRGVVDGVRGEDELLWEVVGESPESGVEK